MPGCNRNFDRLAVGLSSLCLIHCLVLPLLALLLPAIGVMLGLSEQVHIWLLLAALPVSCAALWSGHRNHCRKAPTVGAALGFVLLGLGAFATADAAMELSLTVAGGLALIAAHLHNGRLASACYTIDELGRCYNCCPSRQRQAYRLDVNRSA